MEYQIILPEIIDDEWQNVGIDFEHQSITGNIKGENFVNPLPPRILCIFLYIFSIILSLSMMINY